MDSIANMMVKIRNAQAVGKETVSIECSKLRWEILHTLHSIGLIGEAIKKGRKNRRVIEIPLLYKGKNEPNIAGYRRMSKSSRRLYKSYREIFPVRNGFGIGIYSTSLGIMDDKEARIKKIGGEYLFEIW
jgi:small subunit ribosomal protein S8